MRFRCVAVIALWTMIAGPIFGPPVDSTPSRHGPAAGTAPEHPPADPDAADSAP